MAKLGVVLSLLFLIGSVARGGLVVELVADTAPPNPDGSYNPGQSLNLDVWLTSDISLGLRVLQFDHTASSPELSLGTDFDNGTPVYDPTPEHTFDGVPNFLFDYTSLVNADGYTDFSNLQAGPDANPWPASTAYTDLAETGGNMLTLVSGVAFHAGSMPVTLPTQPGVYTLDLLNAGTTDRNQGALLVFGGLDRTPTTIWGSADDGDVEISYSDGGGPATFAVVPEPATALLLGLGGIALIQSRRRWGGPSL